MIENGKINGRQFSLFVFLFIVGSSILFAPSALAAEAKQNAWIAALIGLGVGVLVVYLYTVLGKHYPTTTLVEVSEQVLGKWIGKAVSLSFFSFSFLLSALVLRNIGEFMVTQILTGTPIQFLHIVFLFIVIFGARLGLETLARTAEIFFPWVIMLFILLVFFLFPQIEVTKMQPIFEGGIKPILRAALPFIELIIFMMIFPYVNQRKQAQKAFFIGTIAGGLVLFAVTILSILTLGADITARNGFPSYILGKKISIGMFIERIEVIVAIIWMITIYFKLTILFYVSSLGLAQTLKMSDYRFLLYPLGMITLVLSLITYPNIVYQQNFVSKVWTPYAATYGLVLPLLFIVIEIVKKRSRTTRVPAK